MLVRTLEFTPNPIRKVGLVICGRSQLFIDNLLINGECDVAYSNNDPSRATGLDVTDLNKKRPM